jgi:hypothetical protein
MMLYLFQYLKNPQYTYIWIPAHSEKCAKFKASKLQVLNDDEGPVIIKTDSKPLSQYWQ